MSLGTCESSVWAEQFEKKSPAAQFGIVPRNPEIPFETIVFFPGPDLRFHGGGEGCTRILYTKFLYTNFVHEFLYTNEVSWYTNYTFTNNYEYLKNDLKKTGFWMRFGEEEAKI